MNYLTNGVKKTAKCYAGETKWNMRATACLHCERATAWLAGKR